MPKFRFDLLLLLIVAIHFTPALSDLVISKLDRRVDLTSHIVRMTLTLKVENTGPDPVSEVSLTFPEHQANNLALLAATSSEENGKSRDSTTNLPIKINQPNDSPPSLVWYAASLPKELGEGQSLNIDVLAVFTHTLQPFPEKITQAKHQLFIFFKQLIESLTGSFAKPFAKPLAKPLAKPQLFLFQYSAHFTSPYNVKFQTLTLKLPSENVESYTMVENTKFSGSEIKYGPYENLSAFSYSPAIIRFPSNKPFTVAEELVREIEISLSGNVLVSEHYIFFHDGAQSTEEFSRLDYQSTNVRGEFAFGIFFDLLPPGVQSVDYIYRDSSKSLLEIEPRYPINGGFKTSVTLRYELRHQDYLFQSSEGTRFLNFTFGSRMNDLLVENLSMKIVLPKGSKDISVSVPFPVKQSQKTGIARRPTVLVEKVNVVPEHNQYFQVHFKFSERSLLTEPFTLISGFFFLFVTCIIYMHTDFSISKPSASYLAKLKWDEVLGTIQQLHGIITRCLLIHDKLEASLRELCKTGDVEACKAIYKSAETLLKDLSNETNPLLALLQSSPQAAHILLKVEELVLKEKDLQEKIMLKHTIVVDSYQKKSGGLDTENRVASIQQKITALKHQVDDLLEYVDNILS